MQIKLKAEHRSQISTVTRVCKPSDFIAADCTTETRGQYVVFLAGLC